MEFIKNVLEKAIEQLSVEKERQVENIKNRISQEIAPKYNEIENIKNESIGKLTSNFNANKLTITEQYNNQIISLQNKYEEERKNIIDNCENRKIEIFNGMLTRETSKIEEKFKREIERLKIGIEENKE